MSHPRESVARPLSRARLASCPIHGAAEDSRPAGPVVPDCLAPRAPLLLILRPAIHTGFYASFD